MAIDVNIPSQVKNYANLAAFPATGTLKTIFIAEDTNKTYRWTGSAYVEISPAGASGITIGTTAITSGTVGRVLFEGTGNVVQESANLFWDNTNKRLGIGTSSPSTTLVLQQDGSSFIRLVRNLSTTEFGMFITNVRNGAGNAGGVFTANNFEFRDSVGTTAYLTINAGNVLINTTTDAGFKLDVNGTARVSSIMAGTQTSISSGVKLESDTNIRAWNQLQLGQFNSTNLTSSQLQYTASGASGYMIANSTSHTATTGDYYALRLQNNIAPTSGTGVFNLLDIVSTINQTGGANGITRGLYVNPTLTSASDFRAIETTNGKVIFNGGNVGIGTSSPLYKLSVSGSIDGGVNLIGNIGQNQGIQGLGGSGEFRFVNGGGMGWFFTWVQNGSEKMRLTTSNNLLINTTTDAGFKLDVNGTARLKATGDALTLDYTAQSLRFYNDGSSNPIYLIQSNSASKLAVGYTFNYYFSFDHARKAVAISTDSGAGAPQANASAVLDLTSTSKGFLPPRMTTTQKNAIASPVAGLQIYDSTLNRPCFYDGTSWITL